MHPMGQPLCSHSRDKTPDSLLGALRGQNKDNINSATLFTPKLTAWSRSVSSRRRFRHLAAASLFLSLRTRRFSSSSGLSCASREERLIRHRPGLPGSRFPGGLAPPCNWGAKQKHPQKVEGKMELRPHPL